MLSTGTTISNFFLNNPAAGCCCSFTYPIDFYVCFVSSCYISSVLRFLPSPLLLNDFLHCVQVKTSMADLQFLFCDIFLVTLLAIVMGRGGPSTELQPRRPPASLLALPVLGSLFIHVCLIVLGQLAALFITTSQDWSVKKILLYICF